DRSASRVAGHEASHKRLGRHDSRPHEARRTPMRSKAVLTRCGALLLVSGATAMAGVRVTQLRTEYLSHPLGIDAVQPRLSWVLESDERGVRQAAYQILVAGAKDELNGDKGGLWDSGEVLSSDT